MYIKGVADLDKRFDIFGVGTERLYLFVSLAPFGVSVRPSCQKR